MTLSHFKTTTFISLASLLWPLVVSAAEDAAALTKALNGKSAAERAKAAADLADLGPKAKVAVPQLIESLKDSDVEVRGQAAYALGQIGDQRPAVVDALFAAAADKEPLVRRAAIRALRSLKLPRDLVMPKMVTALKSAAPADAAAILSTIAEAGDQAVPFLIECLDNKDARYWACLALADIGPAAKKAVPQLTRLQASDEPQLRLQSLVALGQIGPHAKSAVPAIAKSLQSDKVEGVRYAAAFALGQIGAGDKQSRAALTKATESDDAFLQVVSAWALARVAKDDKKLQDKLSTLILDALGSDKVAVRRAAARALAEINPPPEVAAPRLIKAIHDGDPSVIGNAIDALASLGTQIVPRIADNALKNKELRLYATRVLARIGPDAKEAAPALAEALADAQGDFRREAQFVLGMFGSAAAPAVPELIKSLTSDDEQIRNSAVYALGKIGPAAKAASPELRSLLSADDDFVRFAATWALVRIDPKDSKLMAAAVPALIKGLSDERPLVRAESATTLGDLGPAAKSALPELKKAAGDSEQSVSTAAKQAIDKISGK